MKFFYVAALWITLSLGNLAQAEQALSADDLPQLAPQRVHEYFYVESYGADNLGLQQALGYQLNYFLSDYWQLGVMVTGAALGNRSGYGTVSLGLGYLQNLAPKLDAIAQLYLGGGGGHDLPTGGGLVLNLATGLRWAPLSQFGFGLNVGGLNFLSGTFRVGYVNVGIYNDCQVLGLR